MAMGARRADILRLVMTQGPALVTIGSVAGLVLARAGIRAQGAIVAELARVTGASHSDPVLLIGALSCLPRLLWWPAICPRGPRRGSIRSSLCGRSSPPLFQIFLEPGGLALHFVELVPRLA
jgi:hypothetical protein